MILALRKTSPTNATLWQRIACWIIKARLVSAYCHGGIVINGYLIHSTSDLGLHAVRPDQWTPAHWDLFEVDCDDNRAMRNYEALAGAPYDWFSLLAFVGLKARDAKRFYCFEWCYLAMTGESPTVRVTPEMMLLKMNAKRATQAA